MPVINEYKAIFIHIPKTAGTSIYNFFKVNNTLWSKIGTFGKVRVGLEHARAMDLKQFDETKNIFDEYFKFSFVRNPYDRVLSQFFWQCRLIKHEEPDVLLFNRWLPEYLDDKLLFEGFVDSGEKRYILRQHRACSEHYLPQYNFLYDEEENLLIDFIGRYENLENDLKLILKKINYTKEVILPRLNTNDKAFNKEEYLTEHNKSVIYEKYKKDFMLFNYDK